MIKKIYFYLAFPMFFTSGCNNHTDYHTKKVAQVGSHAQNTPRKVVKKQEKRTITVWIHGTRTLSKTLFRNYFRCIKGMQKPHAYKSNNNLLTIANSLYISDSDNFPLRDIRIFGWSGLLSAKARAQAANDLYQSLIELIAEYEQRYGVAPRIRLITHSHGGNVTLYLSEIAKQHNVKLTIDEVVLLACPVQRMTVDLIKNEIFKDIISVYSNMDIIQVLDPQGVYDIKEILSGGKSHNNKDAFFSKRRFPDQKNLTQVEVKKGRRGISHIEFIWRPFTFALPDLLKKLNGRPDSRNVGQQFLSKGLTFKV